MLHWNLAAGNYDTNYHQGEWPSYPQPCCSRVAVHNTLSQFFGAMQYISLSLYLPSLGGGLAESEPKRKLVFVGKTGFVCSIQTQVWTWYNRTRDIVVFIPHIFLPCQSSVPTLLTIQLDHWQFGQRFECVIAVANVASSYELIYLRIWMWKWRFQKRKKGPTERKWKHKQITCK